MTKTIVIDYGMGNLRSISNALRTLGADVLVTERPEHVRSAERLVLPGVGAFGRSMHELRERSLVEPMREAVACGTPLLGICLGFQVLFEASTEHAEREDDGVHAGLSLVHGRVERFGESSETTQGDNGAVGGQVDEPLIVPHMGWNRIVHDQSHPLLDGVSSGSHVYFVHSFRPETAGRAEVIARTDYGGWFVSAVAADNVAGFQFHPEKSGRIGLKLLHNFMSWSPS